MNILNIYFPIESRESLYLFVDFKPSVDPLLCEGHSTGIPFPLGLDSGLCLIYIYFILNACCINKGANSNTHKGHIEGRTWWAHYLSTSLNLPRLFPFSWPIFPGAPSVCVCVCLLLFRRRINKQAVKNYREALGESGRTETGLDMMMGLGKFVGVGVGRGRGRRRGTWTSGHSHFPCGVARN